MWVLVLGTSCQGHHQHKGPNLIRTDTEATTEPVTCMQNSSNLSWNWTSCTTAPRPLIQTWLWWHAVSPVQFKLVSIHSQKALSMHLEKHIMHSTQSLRSSPNITLKTVPMFILLAMALYGLMLSNIHPFLTPIQYDLQASTSSKQLSNSRNSLYSSQ